MGARPTAPRPLSPHLTVWKWRVHMLVSILHRATGNAMAFGAVLLFVWWLVALATGPDAYRTFLSVATGQVGLIVGVGFTWVFFQHMGSGLRHLVMDAGQGYEIGVSKRMATATFAFSGVMTLLTWAWILISKGYVG